MRPIFTLRDAWFLRAFCLPKATVFVKRLESCIISDHRQLISSHRFAEHLKQCCTLNSERLLHATPVEENLRRVEKDRMQ